MLNDRTPSENKSINVYWWLKNSCRTLDYKWNKLSANVSVSKYQKAFYAYLTPFFSTFRFILIFLMSLVVLSTMYDVSLRKCQGRNRNEILLSFSLMTNGRNLLCMDQSNSETITCLHGIRGLSIFSIMFFHSYFFRVFTPFHDEAIFNEWVKSSFASSISALNISVDSFLVMSAALTARSILKELDLWVIKHQLGFESHESLKINFQGKI